VEAAGQSIAWARGIKFARVSLGGVLDTISAALRDRLEVIELTGYTEEEKLEIARRYLVPRQLRAWSISAVSTSK